MNINSNYGNMPHYGNMPSYGNLPHFQIPTPMPRVIDDCGTGFCPPKGGIIPNYRAPITETTINYFGKSGPDLINYFGSRDHKTYTMQSYDCPPGVYTMVDVNWQTPVYPQPVYQPHPMPMYNWGAK